MKTRIDIIIHKPGKSLRELVDMIGTANGSGGGLTLENVEGWVIACKMGFPFTREKWHSLRLSDYSLAISEDSGETFVSTLKWIELEELQPGETGSLPENQKPSDPKTGDDELTEAEKTFLEMWEGCEEKTDLGEYPDSVFWFKDGKFMFELDKKNNILWCSYSRVWYVLSNKNQWKYHEVQNFIKIQVEKHFKMKDVTPRFITSPRHYPVEKHFKMKDVTPRFRVDAF